MSLTGHLFEEWQRQWAGVIAAQVKGVTRVPDEILPDHILRDGVIRALIEDARPAVYLIRVRCNSGWISMGGMVPTIEAAQAAEEVATRIPAVRGILSLTWVVGLPWTNPYDLEPARRAFQPGMGAVVYDGLTDRQVGGAGRVSQNILDPRNRLLSHLVIQVKEPKTGRRLGDKRPELTARERVIPVSAIEAVNRDSVWLMEGEEINWYPVFHPDMYPLATQDWQPPFPYKKGRLRWSCL